MADTNEQTPFLNSEALDNLRELQEPGEPDPVAELIELILQDTPQQLEILQAALDADEPEEACRAVHSLHGSFRHLGVDSVTAFCAEFEETLRNREMERAHASAGRLKELLATIKPRLEEEVRKSNENA